MTTVTSSSTGCRYPRATRTTAAGLHSGYSTAGWSRPPWPPPRSPPADAVRCAAPTRPRTPVPGTCRARISRRSSRPDLPRHPDADLRSSAARTASSTVPTCTGTAHPHKAKPVETTIRPPRRQWPCERSGETSTPGSGRQRRRPGRRCTDRYCSIPTSAQRNSSRANRTRSPPH